jgi:enoyl-CoA hydratase
MSDDDVLVEERQHPRLLVLRLNRPQALNALNLALRKRIAAAMASADGDPEISAVVLTGSARAFCAGADLNEYVDATPLQIVARGMDRLWDAIAQCRKPVIAAVRGYALGGGCELAMHADIVIAGDTARLGQPEVGIGLMPGGGATQRLTRAVGKFRAMQLLLTGAQFSAADALSMGLVSEVVPDAEVESRAIALAQRIGDGPQLALQCIKQAVLAAANLPLDQGLALERRSFQLLFATQDKSEGIRARLEKREPRFDR